MMRLGPPSSARRPTALSVDNGSAVLVPYVARQRLLTHRLHGELSTYLPPKVYFGREAQHVEDRKRPNHFAILGRWLKQRNWRAADYLYVVSLVSFDGLMASPQELTKRRIENLYRKSEYRGYLHLRTAMLVREAAVFCRAVLLKQRALESLPHEEFPALLECVVLDQLGMSYADARERELKMQLAACQYLADGEIAEQTYAGAVPKPVLARAERLRTEILAHGGSDGSE